MIRINSLIDTNIVRINMKIIVAADWYGEEIYAGVFKNGFEKLGHEVKKFSWKEYFKHYQYSHRYETDNNFFKSIYYRFQNKFILGPVVDKINRDFVDLVKSYKPDLLFVYRGTHIYPETLKAVNETGCKIYGYNNDDPFSPHYPKFFWRHFIKGVNYYDHLFCYRIHNIVDYNKMGYSHVSLLRSYYVNERNFPLSEKNKNYNNDVVFVGHYENDGRDESLLHLFEEKVDLKIYGIGWEKSPLIERIKEFNGEVKPVYDDYNEVLSSAKIALVFLSKLNRDTYTRRCFEIPAANTLMLSEYTGDLDSLFCKGVDADYFSSKEELLSKIDFYLNNQSKLDGVAENGRRRLLKDGHELLDRVQQVLDIYSNS